MEDNSKLNKEHFDGRAIKYNLPAYDTSKLTFRSTYFNLFNLFFIDMFSFVQIYNSYFSFISSSRFSHASSSKSITSSNPAAPP